MKPYTDRANQIVWTPRAVKQLLRLEVAAQRRIRDAVGRLVTFPDTTGVRRLVGAAPMFRLRCGRHRVLFSFDGVIRVVTIEEVRKRDEHTY